MYSVRRKILSVLKFIFKKLKNFKRYFTRIFCILIYVKAQSFTQLSLILTKLCHIMRGHVENIFTMYIIRLPILPVNTVGLHQRLLFDNKQKGKAQKLLIITVSETTNRIR